MNISPIEMSRLVANRALDYSLIEHTSGIRSELGEGKPMKDIGLNMKSVDLSLTRRAIITEFAFALEDFKADAERVRALREALVAIMGLELSKTATVEGIDANDEGLKASAIKMTIGTFFVNVASIVIDRGFFNSVLPGKDLKNGDKVFSLKALLDPTVIRTHTPEVINVKGVYQFDPHRPFILTQTNTRVYITPNESFIREESAKNAIEGTKIQIVASGCLAQLAAKMALSYQERLEL